MNAMINAPATVNKMLAIIDIATTLPIWQAEKEKHALEEKMDEERWKLEAEMAAARSRPSRAPARRRSSPCSSA